VFFIWKMAGQFSAPGAKAKKARPIIRMKEFIITFARYVAAILVAFVVSIFVFFLFFAVSSDFELWKQPIWVTWWVVGFMTTLAGFSGVFVGSLCFEHAKRLEGAVVLLIFGLLFCFWFQCLVMGGEAHPGGWFWWLGTAGLGGLGAVILAFWRSARKS
jgi:hypothetical protein